MNNKRHVAFWNHFRKVDRGGQPGKSTGLCHDISPQEEDIEAKLKPSKAN